VDEAQSELLASAAARRVGSERVPLMLAAGRVLSVAVTSSGPLPAYDQSTMDGYAVASSARLPQLDVVGESRAGAEAPPLVAGTTCRIFTGAPLPRGADAVVPQENVTRTGDRIQLDPSTVTSGACIRRAGSDLEAGAIALAAGTRLGAGAIALAGMLDRPEVVVARRPVVTIVATGDELRAPGEAARPASIPESNGAAIAALASQAGATVRIAPLARDERAATTAALRDALGGTDLLVTIGGVSVGDHDVVRPALADAGVTLDFWRVAIRPGKPLAVGHTTTALVLGLPGNPASALVTFALFGVPLLRALQGDLRPLPFALPAVWAGPPPRGGDRTEFVRVTLGTTPGDGRRLTARPHGNQASGAATSLAASEGLARLPPTPPGAARGGEGNAEVDVVRWSDL
jgi:molybdopterin molybdotransferase